MFLLKINLRIQYAQLRMRLFPLSFSRITSLVIHVAITLQEARILIIAMKQNHILFL